MIEALHKIPLSLRILVIVSYEMILQNATYDHTHESCLLSVCRLIRGNRTGHKHIL